MIRVLYFASFRERLQTDAEALPACGIEDVGSVLHQLRQRDGAWGEIFAEGQTVMIAVNQEMADSKTPVKDGDELAFFPPVTGG
jgi:molybdopterin synthase sulfur carrier subunit